MATYILPKSIVDRFITNCEEILNGIKQSPVFYLIGSNQPKELVDLAFDLSQIKQLMASQNQKRRKEDNIGATEQV